jgi:hypothetical protein
MKRRIEIKAMFHLLLEWHVIWDFITYSYKSITCLCLVKLQSHSFRNKSMSVTWYEISITYLGLVKLQSLSFRNNSMSVTPFSIIFHLYHGENWNLHRHSVSRCQTLSQREIIHMIGKGLLYKTINSRNRLKQCMVIKSFYRFSSQYKGHFECKTE